MRRIAAAAALALAVLVGSSASALADSKLERSVLDAVRAAHFEQVYDWGANADDGVDAAVPAPHIPNVDVAVIELNPGGQVRGAAHVLLSRDQPDGLVVGANPTTLDSSAIDYRRWSTTAYDSDEGYDSTPTLTGTRGVGPRFMTPYPASLLKSMVLYAVTRLADRGVLDPAAAYTYPGGDDGLCGDATPETQTVDAWSSDMISWSSNRATCALLTLLHHTPTPDGSGVDFLNADLARIGLGSLQLKGTDPTTGTSWTPGLITMTSLDTAKLFLLFDGARGTLWRTPGRTRVRSDLISDAGRARIKGYLADQAFHEVLSTGNWCGHTTSLTGDRVYPGPGIPARVPDRWIDPITGIVGVPQEGVFYANDVRPCNAQAEVTFLHKTGLTTNAGSDAGIVTSLPGKPYRHYVIAVTSNLGYRYGDPELRSLIPNPCFNGAVDYICYTERLAKLGGAIDAALSGHGPRGGHPGTKGRQAHRRHGGV